MSDSDGQVRKSNKQMVLTIILVIVVAAAIFGGGAYLFAQLTSGHVKTSGGYATTQLSPSSYVQTLEVDGSIESTDTLSVSPQVDGTISDVAVSEGDKVTKAQTLFTIKNESIVNAAKTAKSAYSRTLKEQSQAEEGVTEAQAKLVSAKAKLAAAKETAEELQASDPTYIYDLTPYEDAVSAAQSAVASAKSAQGTVREATASAKSAYTTAKKQVAALTVKAGKGGTVTDVLIKKGMTTAAVNAQGAALEIVNLDTLEAVVLVSESDVSSIAVGQAATVTSDSLSGTQISATVTKVAKTPDKTASASSSDGTNYYDVTLTLGTTNDGLKVGMSVKATLQLRDYGTVFYVPQNAVGENGVNSYVEAVYSDGTTNEIQVTVVGTSVDGQSIITGTALQDGMNIRSDLS